MDTLLTPDPIEAATLLCSGHVVAFPTETVYGLGADIFQPDAVQHIFAAKGRPADNPLIVHVARLAQIEQVSRTDAPHARRLIDTFFPGPLTLILPRRPGVPDVVTGGLDTVGVRMPHHPVAQAFLEACDRPVAAPSANLSGRPSPTTWQAVHTDLDGRIACILQGNRSEAGLESTVVDCTGDVPLVLRAGVVTVEALRVVLPAVQVHTGDAGILARSPGTRYRHYAPNARIFLVTHSDEIQPSADTAYIGMEPPDVPDALGLFSACPTVETYAHELFDFFRRCDDAGLARIYCQRIPPTGLGRALMDRLERAAAGSNSPGTSDTNP